MIKRIIQYASAAAVMLLVFVFIAAPSQSDAQKKKDLPAKRINPVDGAEMVLIPAGEFTMGSPDDNGSDDERPQLKIYLDAFYIYKYEVTNSQFEKFAGKTGYKSRWGMGSLFQARHGASSSDQCDLGGCSGILHLGKGKAAD